MSDPTDRQLDTAINLCVFTGVGLLFAFAWMTWGMAGVCLLGGVLLMTTAWNAHKVKQRGKRKL